MKIKDLINLYENRYYNINNIVKYQNPNIDYVKESFGLVKKEYYELLYNSIIKNDLYFCGNKCHSSFMKGYKNDNIPVNICTTQFDYDDYDAMIHELGHNVDIGINKSEYAFSVIVGNNKTGKTLYETLMEELKYNHKDILNMILEEYKCKLDKEFGNGTYDLFIESVEIDKKIKSLKAKVGVMNCYGMNDPKFSNKPDFKKNMEEYKKVYKRQSEIHTGDIINKVINSNAHSEINDNYYICTDILSYKYDMFNYFHLPGHPISYYKKNPILIVHEFFANMFCAELTGNNTVLNTVKKLFPNSYEAFYDLLNFLKNNIYI